MVGVTSIQVKENLEDLTARLRQAKTLKVKERLQVLYWLKQEDAPSISAIALAVGKHRGTIQTWLSSYRQGGLDSMLTIKSPPGGVRVISCFYLVLCTVIFSAVHPGWIGFSAH